MSHYTQTCPRKKSWSLFNSNRLKWCHFLDSQLHSNHQIPHFLLTRGFVDIPHQESQRICSRFGGWCRFGAKWEVLHLQVVGSFGVHFLHSPSLTWNPKMMVSKSGVYSRVSFSGSMLNFGRGIDVGGLPKPLAASQWVEELFQVLWGEPVLDVHYPLWTSGNRQDPI